MKSFLSFLFINLIISNFSFAGVVVLNGLTHFHQAGAGEEVWGEIHLQNVSNIEQRVTFHLNDMLFECGSQKTYKDHLPHKNSSYSWFDGNLNDKVLLPYEKFTYRYSIRVPSEDSIKGSYWSALLIRVEKPIKEEDFEGGMELKSKIQYAVSLVTHVNKFDDLQLEYENIDLGKVEADDKKFLAVNIQNHGKFMEWVDLQLEVFNKEGIEVYKTQAKKKPIIPGSCSNFNLDISGLPPGEYECLLLSQSRKEYMGVNISLVKE